MKLKPIEFRHNVSNSIQIKFGDYVISKEDKERIEAGERGAKGILKEFKAVEFHCNVDDWNQLDRTEKHRNDLKKFLGVDK